MIRLRFNTLQKARGMTLGPAPYFRVEGSLLREGPGNEVVGEYRQHHWSIRGQLLSSWECRDRARVHFEDARGMSSAVYGPFNRLHFPNGSCYADDRRFAEMLEDSAFWIHCTDETRWSSIVITPADV